MTYTVQNLARVTIGQAEDYGQASRMIMKHHGLEKVDYILEQELVDEKIIYPVNR